MSAEGILGLFLGLAIIGWVTLALPSKASKEKKKEVECPKCKTKNERLCPNCSNALPEGSLTCSKCHLEAEKIPCKACGTNLKGMPS
ncbi:MAG: hypothetical protein ACLP1W_10710 [Rhodomicrobium sp.]